MKKKIYKIVLNIFGKNIKQINPSLCYIRHETEASQEKFIYFGRNCLSAVLNGNEPSLVFLSVLFF